MAYCHKAVRDIAKEMAGAAYERMAQDDDFYARFPSQNLFIAKNWKSFVGYARGSLLQILSGDFPEAVKADTFDIYLKDRVLQDVQEGVPMGRAMGSA